MLKSIKHVHITKMCVKLRLLEVKCDIGIYYSKIETRPQDTIVFDFMPAGEFFS